MKNRILLLSVAVMLHITNNLSGQSTSFSTDFSNPTGANGTWALILAQQTDVFTKTISNGELKIEYNKTQWSFIQLWIRPFNITPDPYLKFTAKSNAAGSLIIRIKDQNGNTVEKTIDLITDYQEYYFNLTADLPAFNSTLDEIQFDVGYGDYSGILYFNDFMMGEAAKPQLILPTIDQVDNFLVFKGQGKQSIKLTGITDGGDGNQFITVDAASNDTSLIKDLAVQYTSPDDTAALQFTPSSEKVGTSAITVTVTDNGEIENTTSMNFNIIIAEYGSTGFTDDFENMQMDTLWDQINPDYLLERTGGELAVNVHKNSGSEYFSCKLPGIFDFSILPYINVDIKGDQPCILLVQLVDMNDKSSSREIRVMKASDFIRTMFDYTSETRIDMEHIREVRFAVNPLALTFDGNIRLDNLRIGSDAVKCAYLANPGDKTYYMNTENTSILITDIANASEINVATGSGLIENAYVSDIINGIATLYFDIITDSTGSDTITLTAIGEGNWQDNSVSFVVTVAGNFPPEIDPPQDLITSKGSENILKLTGLSDGDPAVDQSLTIEAVSDNVGIIPNPVSVVYQQGSPYGYITITPVDTGTANITITVKDNNGGLDSAITGFTIKVYGSINNPPTCDAVNKVSVFNNAGEQTVSLTGISDGDNSSQNLTLKAISSVDSIVANPLQIDYSEGDNATLTFTPDPLYTGISTVTLTIVDDGGTPENNGNDSIVISFEIETRLSPKTGYVVPFEGNASALLQGEGQFFHLSYVDSVGFRAIKIEMTDKWDYGGLWMDIPYELDLTDYPYISYEVYTVNNITYHWNYFYDVNVERNIQNSSAHMLPAAANQWVTISFDYSDPGDMYTEAGTPIQADRVADVLFNLHNRPGSWPFTDYSGTVYYRNIRIGDKAVIPPKTPVATINGVPEQVHFTGEGEVSLTLSGISDGAGSTEGVTVTAVSNLPQVIANPEVGTLQPDGTNDITYNVSAVDGIAPISVTIACTGSNSKTIKFDINVLKKDIASTVILTIDQSVTYQKMVGFGSFQNESRWTDLYAVDLGASAMRVGLIGNQIEPVNDNDDPYVLNRDGLNYDAFDWDYFRKLKEKGVETFILTSWSPPAWMKHNLSVDWSVPLALGSTKEVTNYLEYYYYEEYAESMAAVVKMFEEESIGDASMGFSTGGAKDIGNFRENIKNGYLPLPTNVTYEGLFYDYYFDTGQAVASRKLFSPSYSYAVTRDPLSGEKEYYLSVGLNSGIKENQFELVKQSRHVEVSLDVNEKIGGSRSLRVSGNVGEEMPQQIQKPLAAIMPTQAPGWWNDEAAHGEPRHPRQHGGLAREPRDGQHRVARGRAERPGQGGADQQRAGPRKIERPRGRRQVPVQPLVPGEGVGIHAPQGDARGAPREGEQHRCLALGRGRAHVRDPLHDAGRGDEIVRFQRRGERCLQVMAPDLEEAGGDALDHARGDLHHDHERHEAEGDAGDRAPQVAPGAAPAPQGAQAQEDGFPHAGTRTPPASS